MVPLWVAVLANLATGVLAWLWGHAVGITRGDRFAEVLDRARRSGVIKEVGRGAGPGPGPDE